MSLIHSKNNSGPRMVPCGTPDVTITGVDFVPLTLNCLSSSAKPGFYPFDQLSTDSVMI